MVLHTLLLSVFCSVSANAGEAAEIDCAKVISTPDVEQCIAFELDKVEAGLNEAYQRLLKQLTQVDTPQDNYTEYRKKLLIAQRAWIKFREADCDAQYEMHRSGTIRNSIYLSCKKQRAEQRINELNSYAPY
ncbi:lysozyme inhibitor LprI family protein [Stutzerimonas kunmingensis]|uniref:lysozyme inhibitor LprI family protein n=1 Tax=Stutzerimonas kunmingensis TaxID=1211807 RepID=UPI0028AD29C4|nr:lysozyme inhibitor LprI family protein [Stutzerimonas kunmingensis]